MGAWGSATGAGWASGARVLFDQAPAEVLEMSPASLGQVLMAGIQTEDLLDSLEERHQGIALQGLHLVEQTVDAELD